ncbi:MAG TPA: response regulator [Allosphingosinicella sp.]|nr:response regulator [Allosphingosinicella sp.]
MPDSRSILIVEDEPLIAMMLEDFLDSLGHRIVAVAETVRDALARVDEGGFDVAIVDVHLKGEKIWPVVERLSGRGIPFVLATGGHVDPPPAEYEDAPVLTKPYTIDAIEPALQAALGAKA